MTLTWDQIKAAKGSIPREQVEIPALGGHVFVRGMTGAERDRFEARALLTRQLTDVAAAEKAYDNYKARLLASCIVDEQGRRIVPQGGEAALGDLPGAVLSRLFDVCLRLSGLGADAVDDAEKNSVAGPSDASTSTSPENSE